MLQLSKLLIIIIALLGPYILWAVVFAAAKRNLFALKSMLRVLSVLHWLLVIVAAVLLLAFFGQPPSRYGWGALISGFGLMWPEQWLKRKMSLPHPSVTEE